MQGQGVEMVPRPTGCQSSGPARDGKGATPSHKKSDVGGDGPHTAPLFRGSPHVNGVGGQVAGRLTE